MELIILAAATALLALWLFSLRQRLTVLAENADQALARFSTQQSSCFNALAALLELTEEYAPGELLVQYNLIRSGFAAMEYQLSPHWRRRRKRSLSCPGYLPRSSRWCKSTRRCRPIAAILIAWAA